MDMDLADKELSDFGHLNLKLEGGKIVLVVTANKAGTDVDLNVKMDPDYFIDMLAAAIPGTIDDTIFAIIKAALKA